MIEVSVQADSVQAEGFRQKDFGVEAGRIFIEEKARSTFENAVYTGRIIRERNWQRVVLVTDCYHLPRAAFIFERLGISVEGSGVPPAHGVTRATWLRQHMGERLRLVRCAALFALGAHKSLVARVWGQ